MRGGAIILIAAVAALLVAGCGEKTAVTVYKQGHYQGKPDKQPWDNERFNGDKAGWEKTIKARNDGQNEYTRVTAK